MPQEERAAAAAAAEELRAEVQREADEAAAAKISEANARYQDVLAQLKAERQRIASLQAELQAERTHGVTLEVRRGSKGWPGLPRARLCGAAVCCIRAAVLAGQRASLPRSTAHTP